MIPIPEQALENGEIDGFDLGFARALVGRLPLAETELGPVSALLAARLSRGLSEGDTCLDDLDALTLAVSGGRLSWGDVRAAWAKEGLLDGAEGSPAREGWTAPFVVDEEGRLYLRRYFQHERSLADGIARRLGPSRSPRGLTGPEERLLDRFFPPPSDPLQREAARRALAHSFCLVTGGPGTGKTTTVARILATLVLSEREREGRVPEVLLLAPTGKAAARMRESLLASLSRLGLSEGELALFPTTSSTIHRALGVSPESPTRFRRTEENPLPYDVVVVDEASMIDVRLMDALLRAVSEGAKTILLGDVHQLASVDAGCVLGEVARFLRSLPAESAPLVELERSYRFSEDSAIHRLASAVKEGRVADAFDAAARGADVELRELAPDTRELPGFWDHVVRGYRPALTAKTPEESLARLSEYRVLLAHRRGARGTETMNLAIRAALARAGLCPETGDVFAGFPILVTENDPVTRLSNGDVGVVFPDEGGRLSAFFDAGGGVARRVSLAELPAYEAAFAMTIHKSQGSEYEEVAIVLPEVTSPLLGRELLYTAITRAKRAVVLWSTRASVERAVLEAARRKSGLFAAIERARSSFLRAPA